MKPTAEDVRFERVGRDRLGEIAALTERDERDIEYLLFSDLNPASRAFGLLGADGRVAGFVGFVHNPFWYHGTHYQSFRSGFTIAVPELRGTGIFPRFYRWVVDQLLEEFGRELNYFWGETRHPGWGKFGFAYRSRYSFYQLRETAESQLPHLHNITSAAPYRISRRVVRALAPPVRTLGRDVEVAADLPYDRFHDLSRRNTRPNRCVLEYDAARFRHRFAGNPFIDYDFLLADDGLLIVGRQHSVAMLSDVRCNSRGTYLRLMAHALERYPNLVVHANIRSEARSKYFWANLRLGFTLLVGGGSYIENADTAPDVAFRDIPLYEAWAFGTHLI
jgi:hypothetical protein